MNFMKLFANNKTCVLLNVWYGDKTIEEVERNKFFGVQIDSNFSWKPNLPRFFNDDSYITCENRRTKIISCRSCRTE